MAISSGIFKWVLFVATSFLIFITLPNYSETFADTVPYQQNQPVVAMWLDHTKLIESNANDIIRFSHSHGVNRIYLQVDEHNVPMKAYETFIGDANLAGIQVYSLNGDPNWGIVSEYPYIKEYVDWVITYNRAVNSSAKFSGIDFDIEPYLLSGWKDNMHPIAEQWSTNMQEITQYIRKNSDLKVSADIPFWLNHVGSQETGVNMMSIFVKMFDNVDIMDYRNVAQGQNGIIDLALPIVRAADGVRSSVVVGVNVGKPSELSEIRFCGMPEGQMGQQIDILKHALASHPAFSGYAVEDYEEWSALNSEQ